MTYLLQDLTGFALGTLIAPFIFYLPGAGLLRLIMPRCAAISFWQRAGWASLLAIAILPAVNALVIRFAGIPAAMAVAVLLAAYGVPFLRPHAPRWRRLILALAIALLWWLICAWSYADYDQGGRLYQSLIAYDMVKHAAVAEQIARHDIPFPDPFFARGGIAGYYHYFYIWPAMVRWIGGTHVSAPMAVAATAFWTGIAVPALLWRIAAEAKFIDPGRERRVALLAILFCFVAGADLLFMLFRFLGSGTVKPMVDQWNEEVRFLATSTLWVPHHVTALVAGWTGMLLAVRAGESEEAHRNRLVAGAGIAFATMFGASLWVAFTLAPVLVIWALTALSRRDGRLCAAGLIAVLAILPQLVDLLRGRMAGEVPVGLEVRYFSVIAYGEAWPQQLMRAVLLPLNYGMEFGVFALGAGYFWLSQGKGWRDDQPVRRLLLLTTIISLIMASFVRSTIINNDLGWRSILFAQLAAMIWTIAVAQRLPSLRALSPPMILLLVLGLLATIWDIAGLRVIRPPLFPTPLLKQNAHPEWDHAMRGAYSWADAHLPPDAVLQHNPGLDYRALDFGLYGRHWPAVADEEAMLFGASKSLVNQRMAVLAPVFTGPSSRADLYKSARAAGVDYFLFTRRDPVWSRAGGPPPAIRCVYRTSAICIGTPRQDIQP
ncbi:hypothetical protein DM806_03540 [Sphingobium lactosutens]|uniref:hypothetical protein n=1 Tax=Sphingobium lactosutens TaxID=522773 RepID=UPI0015BCFE2C|nr:hypothetical protein [Sphingobium lactosutens]NWK94751.1 hypothetical protein [Sphingobium lactosutens]